MLQRDILRSSSTLATRMVETNPGRRRSQVCSISALIASVAIEVAGDVGVESCRNLIGVIRSNCKKTY